MIAKFNGTCRICRAAIAPGEEIQILLRKWTHAACKAAEIARRSKAAGAPREVPQATFGNESVTFVGTRGCRRRARVSFQSQQQL